MIEKNFRAGKLAIDGSRPRDLWITVRLENDKLSISGVHGPKRNGDATGSCGQNRDDLEDLIRSGEHQALPTSTLEKLLEVWEKFHLNDMNAGCVHQDDWDTSTRVTYKDPFGREVSHPKGHIRFDEHPEGLLAKPCDVCGYKYGTQWLKRDLPDEIKTFLGELPDETDIFPWS